MVGKEPPALAKDKPTVTRLIELSPAFSHTRVLTYCVRSAIVWFTATVRSMINCAFAGTGATSPRIPNPIAQAPSRRTGDRIWDIGYRESPIFHLRPRSGPAPSVLGLWSSISEVPSTSDLNLNCAPRLGALCCAGHGSWQMVDGNSPISDLPSSIFLSNGTLPRTKVNC